MDVMGVLKLVFQIFLVFGAAITTALGLLFAAQYCYAWVWDRIED